MYVKPSPGLRVYDPERKQFMPDEGMSVSDTDLYWARRLRDNDVEKATPTTTQATAVAVAADSAAANDTAATKGATK